jgi:hypothetical protein
MKDVQFDSNCEPSMYLEVYGKSQTPSFSGVNYPALKTETKIRIMK